MNRQILSTYHKSKAAVLLLCFIFMTMASCPVQKLLSSVFSTHVEIKKHPIATNELINNNLSCSNSKEIAKTLLVELNQKVKSNTLPFIPIITLAYSSQSFIKNESHFDELKKRDLLACSIPIHLKNQVFII